jgi:hypothetical protein
LAVRELPASADQAWGVAVAAGGLIDELVGLVGG